MAWRKRQGSLGRGSPQLSDGLWSKPGDRQQMAKPRAISNPTPGPWSPGDTCSPVRPKPPFKLPWRRLLQPSLSSSREHQSLDPGERQHMLKHVSCHACTFKVLLCPKGARRPLCPPATAPGTHRWSQVQRGLVRLWTEQAPCSDGAAGPLGDGRIHVSSIYNPAGRLNWPKGKKGKQAIWGPPSLHGGSNWEGKPPWVREG